MHTMARVKNRDLAAGDSAEPHVRAIGEQQVVDASDRLIANTAVIGGDRIDDPLLEFVGQLCQFFGREQR